jgi:PPOX class probable F420-dependent enzyme
MPSLPPAIAEERFALAPIGRLATVTATGRPHLVPVCFALHHGRVVTAVDAKPKQTRDVARLANVRATGRASVLVDHYEDDWSALWWVRVSGTASVVDGRHPALTRFPAYEQTGAVAATIVLEPAAVTGWRAT